MERAPSGSASATGDEAGEQLIACDAIGGAGRVAVHVDGGEPGFDDVILAGGFEPRRPLFFLCSVGDWC